MFSVWIILGDNNRQRCGREMLQKSEADSIALELRQMGLTIVIEKWSV